MPDVPIVDAHVHLWDPAHCRMSWLDKNDLLNKLYGPAEFTAHTAGLDVQGYVYVETGVNPHFTLVEMRWAAARAAEDPRLKAIVAAAPLEAGSRLKSYLKELLAISPLIKGIRRITQGEKDAASIVLAEDFVAGATLLADFNLSCDLCLRHDQLEPHIELVKRCPKTSFILDHIAKPNIREHKLDPWRENLKKLAALPNIVCKISGAVTEADMKAWQPEDLAPYIQHVLDCFGPDRVCFGGDWPVSLLASPYKRWVETLDGLTRNLPLDARKKLWAENTRRVYRIA